MFRIKQNHDCSIARYKACLVAKGFHQQPGIDFHETFSPVINHITVRIVLSIELNRKLGIRQLDVYNVFLNRHLMEEVYMAQPQGMQHSDYPHHVYTRLFIGSNKLRELCTMSSTPSCSLSALSHPMRTRPSLFILEVMRSSIFLVYVDYLIITGSDPSLVDNIIRQLNSKFSTKDLRVVSFFYGVEVLATSTGLLLSQQKYVIDLLSKHNMLDSKPISTPTFYIWYCADQWHHVPSDGCWSPTSPNDSTRYFFFRE